MRKIFDRIWKGLISRNVAIFLLTVITVMLATGAWLPNPALMSAEDGQRLMTEHPFLYWIGERYNSQKLAGGYVFGFAGVLLIISTTICSIDRLIKLSGTSASTGYFPRSGGSMHRTVMIDKASALGKVEKDLVLWLRKGRFRTSIEREGDQTAIKGVRGTIGFWGSILFHCILITALFGLVSYYLAGYRGRLIFTEGQSYMLEEKRFFSIEKKPVWGMRLPPVEMGLLSQYSLYDRDDPLYPLEHVARFRVADRGAGKEYEKDIRINDPLIIADRKFLLIRGGFSPKVIIRNENGRTLVDKYVALSGDGGTRDSFELASGPVTVKLKLYPDKGEDKGLIYSKSMKLLNPHLDIKISRKGNYIFKDLIPLGKEVQGRGYSVIFPDVRKWVVLEMADEPGIGFFFMISFAGLAGLIARMIDPEERVYFSLSKGENNYSVEINAFSRHYYGLLEEKVASIAERMSGI